MYACIHHSGRSVAAKVLTAHLAGGAVVVRITRGCGETCPVVPGKRYEDWAVEDPKGQDVETVRRIVDDVETRVRLLLADLGVPAA
jgi:arsenate reductase